jgi:Leucine-rich repeat (LRR) protein
MNNSNPQPTPRRPRRHFAFRLRTLFFLTALVACPLGYVMYERHRCDQQKRADALWISKPIYSRHLRAEVRIDLGEHNVESSIPVRSGWKASLLGDNSGDQIVSVSSYFDADRTISRSEMYALSHLGNLRELAVPHAQIEQTGFLYLCALRQLETLDLQQTSIQNDDLCHIARLSKLKILKLNNTKIGNRGASHLANLTNLHRLHLQQTQIGDEGVKHLSKLTKLKYLDLSDTLVTEESLELLAQHTQLLLLALPPDIFSLEARAEIRKRLPKCDIIFAKN